MNQHQKMKEARRLIQGHLDQSTDGTLHNRRVFKIAVDIAPDDLILTVAQASRQGKMEDAMALMAQHIITNAARIRIIYRNRFGKGVLQ
jgi:hypothetical protein